MALEEIGAPKAERHVTVLAEFLYDYSAEGALSAGTSYEFTKSLEKDEVAEITHYEVYSPVAADGTKYAIRIVPVIDNAAIEEYVVIDGYYDRNMMPPLPNAHQWFMAPRIVGFGEPAHAARTEAGIDPLRNTSLKVKDKIGVRVVAGGSDVEADFRIRVWGVLYKTEDELKEAFGDSVYGAESTVVDVSRGKQLRFTKDAEDVTIDNFDALVGGVRQRKPQIMPLIRYATNASATTANEDYEFSLDADEVSNRWEELYWELDDRAAVFIRGFGVRSVSNLKYAGVKIGDSRYPKPNMFETPYYSNPLHYGLAYPKMPSDMPVFLPIPSFQFGYLIHDEKGRIIVRDNGTSISADSIHVAMHGLRIDM